MTKRRAIDDPVVLDRAAKIMRSALSRLTAEVGDMDPKPLLDRSATSLRSASAQDYFPYDAKTVAYIEIKNDGEISNPGRFINDLRQATRRAIAGESLIIAVWPGQWRSDAFIIDDLDQLAKAIKA